jgi:hypothetical protein
MPARQDLSDELAGQEGLDAGGRLASVTQLVMSHGNRWAFTDFLQGALDSVGKELQPYHQAVVEMVQVHQVEMIVSMAYDDLLEQAFHQSGVGLNVVVSDEQLGFVRPDRPTLIKLYGDIRQVASLTVTEQDQNALLRGRVKAEIVDEVQRAFRRNTILFVGYDLNDPFVAVWFDEIAGGRFQSRSYAVWSGLPDQQAAALESNRGLIVLDTDPVAVLYTLAGKRR